MRATTPSERYRALIHWHYVALSLGRPGAAYEATESMLDMEAAGHAPSGRAHRLRILAANYSVGDSASAVEAVHRLGPWVAAPLSEDPTERDRQYRAICGVEQWRLWGGDTSSIARSLETLRRADPKVDPPGAATLASTCATLLEAIRGHVEGAADADVRIARLDSVMRTAPRLSGWSYGNLALARLREARGDQQGALDAARRRPHLWWSDVYWACHLREEGRLAELLGDREGAIRAYKHYLALRHAPEPGVEAEVEGVRSALHRLRGGKDVRRNEESVWADSEQGMVPSHSSNPDPRIVHPSDGIPFTLTTGWSQRE